MPLFSIFKWTSIIFTIWGQCHVVTESRIHHQSSALKTCRLNFTAYSWLLFNPAVLARCFCLGQGTAPSPSFRLHLRWVLHSLYSHLPHQCSDEASEMPPKHHFIIVPHSTYCLSTMCPRVRIGGGSVQSSLHLQEPQSRQDQPQVLLKVTPPLTDIAPYHLPP